MLCMLSVTTLRFCGGLGGVRSLADLSRDKIELFFDRWEADLFCGKGDNLQTGMTIFESFPLGRTYLGFEGVLMTLGLVFASIWAITEWGYTSVNMRAMQIISRSKFINSLFWGTVYGSRFSEAVSLKRELLDALENLFSEHIFNSLREL